MHLSLASDYPAFAEISARIASHCIVEKPAQGFTMLRNGNVRSVKNVTAPVDDTVTFSGGKLQTEAKEPYSLYLSVTYCAY